MTSSFYTFKNGSLLLRNLTFYSINHKYDCDTFHLKLDCLFQTDSSNLCIFKYYNQSCKIKQMILSNRLKVITLLLICMVQLFFFPNECRYWNKDGSDTTIKNLHISNGPTVSYLTLYSLVICFPMFVKRQWSCPEKQSACKVG